jgi:hypothetical protein
MLKNMWSVVTTFIMQKWQFGDMDFSLFDVFALSFILGVAKIILGHPGTVADGIVIANGNGGKESKNYTKFKKTRTGSSGSSHRGYTSGSFKSSSGSVRPGYSSRSFSNPK